MDMDKLVSLCKRRGFLFQSSEIYGGLNGFWDYGPLGVELKRNVKEAWWRDMVTGHDDLAVPAGAPEAFEMAGLDCTIIMHPQVWKCSGHYDLFHDFMVDCRESQKALSARPGARPLGREPRDKRIFVATQLGGDEGLAETEQRALKFFNLRGKDADELAWQGPLVSLTTVKDFPQVLGPDAKELGTLTPPREFNLMFKTYVGALSGEEGAAFLRPETAQGIFVNFKNVLDSSRVQRALRHRADGQELSQRDHAAQLHVPLARIRADGDRVFLPSQVVARVVQVLARSAVSVVSGPGPGRRAAAAARSRRGRAEPLFCGTADIEYAFPVSAAGRVRRAGGDRPSRRFRSAQPHGRQAGAAGQRAGGRDGTTTASRGIAAAART